jgi:radical SAM superfamily enzyme YgiQ (UPF0313 family)
MKVLLISANTETITMPVLPLGLACVAAATRNAGHEVVLLNLMFAGDPMVGLKTAIEDLRPEVIGISVRNIDDQNMPQPHFLLLSVRDVVAACRARSDAPIVLGGAGYSIFPEAALRYLGADIGVPGEGEVVFPLLLDRIAARGALSEVPGIHLPGRPVQRRHFALQLDDLPVPDPGSWIPSSLRPQELWVPVETRRGCPLDCSYCSTALIQGASIRSRSPAQIVKWLAKLAEAGCRNINFVDNTFNLPPAYAKELCRRIREARLDLNLWCIIYPMLIDPELVELMRAAGCRQISFGFESGSDRMLRSLNKQFGVEEIRATSQFFAEAGIKRMGFLLLGGPGETKETVEESLAFADSLKLEALKITTGLRIYPQTPLAITALAEGIVEADDDLLFPRFYLQSELKGWLLERVATYKVSRPWVN